MSDAPQSPAFSRPTRQVLTMILIVVLVSAGGFLIFPTVAPVFLASPFLNGFIFFVFLIGVVACFSQVLSLGSSVNWIEGFAANRPGFEFVLPPRLLKSLAAMMRNQSMNLALSSSSTQTILNSVATRLDERRDITRYIIALLIFLGLLGTFYGLAQFIPGVVDLIRNLEIEEGQDAMQTFDGLLSGLEEPMSGLGTAFGSSLIGLAGSLVVGLLDLFAGHGQNRFFRELEEWLSSLTSVGAGSDGEASASGVVDYIAEQSELMRALLAEVTAKQSDADDRLERLSASVEGLVSAVAGQQAAGQQAVSVIGEGQNRIVSLLEGATSNGQGFLDDDTRARLQNMDGSLLQLLEELSAERQTDYEGLRAEIRALTKAIEKSR
ncbi:MAG: biopolymer transporter ExbB [Pseudomonadota bacterium]